MSFQNNSENITGAIFFAAYVGPSMNPTLREPEIMEILPYDSRPLRVGDVIFFLPPEADQPVVHRIVRVTPAGISTLGDNNTREDPFLSQPERIKGQVVAAWRGQKRRTIAGGFKGRLTSCWLRWRRFLDRGVSPLLHPLYQAMSHWGVIAWLLPAQFRPRVVVFHVQGREQFQLLLGQRIIGRYDDHRNQWQIQRPFHLFVDGRVLPRRKDRERLNQPVLTELRRTMKPSAKQEVCYDLVLADGTRWRIVVGDDEAAFIVAQLGNVMQLRVASDAIDPVKTAFGRMPSSPWLRRSSQNIEALFIRLREVTAADKTVPVGETSTMNRGRQSTTPHLHRLLVQVDAHTSVADCHVPLAPEDDGIVVCVLDPSDHWEEGPHVNLVRLSLIIAREAHTRGGVLIHGALAERNGIGVILAAPGGTGKTTASNRLQAPWRSLCDDTTLVVRDSQGNYWAHPWPTWSRFLDGGPGGSWDVQSAVPLKGIFILAQAVEDRVERVGSGHAVSLLVECVRQASMFMPLGLFKEEINALHLERFNNLCTLAKVIPAHVLHISLTGAFWEKIEQTLGGCR